MRITLLALFLIAGILPVSAQTQMYERLNVPVKVNGAWLKNPFVGGINNAQLSAADLNNDGKQDLVVFDKVGDVVLTYLNTGTPGIASYTYAPQYACNFPPLVDYVLMRDYNKDGAADIFCASIAPGTQEVQVFRGYYENDMLKFTNYFFHYPGCNSCNSLYIWYPDDDMPGFFNNLPISKADYPAVDDIDGDGDLDIVTFEASVGGHVWLFTNKSVEMGYGLDSLKFTLADKCWGRFYESGLDACRNCLSPDPALCGQCFAGPGQIDDREERHPGSTVMTYDQDGDGDKEVVLGDISFDCLNMMTNGGSASQAWMVAQDTAFPGYDVPVELSNFPSSFYLDLNNDGKGDMVVAPNSKTIGEDRKNVWFYANTAATGHHFTLQSKKFLVEDMVDLGTATHPAVADVNGDGLLDIVVGNYGYFTAPTPNTVGTPNNASLYLFLNVGTPTAPAFELTNTDWLGMSEYAPNDFDFVPCFADLDGDFDLDLLVGSNGGSLYCYYNNAGPGSPMAFSQDFNTMWVSMDIGVASAPAVYDVDGDGLVDVILGERQGNVNYFKNIGATSDPQFANQPTLYNLGSVDTDPPGQSVGFSVPFFLPTQNGYQLVCGTQGGWLEAYGNLSATADPFTEVNLKLGNIDEGNRSSPVFADLDEDGILELVCGNLRGGLTLYKTQLVDCTTSTRLPTTAQNLPLQIAPNPTSAWARVTLPGLDGQAEWRVFNALGQQVARGTAEHAAGFSVDARAWETGVYFLEIEAGGQRGTGRILKVERGE